MWSERPEEARIISVVRSKGADALVDAFVQKVNVRRHERKPPEDVPPFLRQVPHGDEPDGWTDWRILGADNSASIRGLESRIGRPFPSAYRSLIARYCFPAFECGPVLFFANTGQNTSYDLSTRLFVEPR